MNLGETQTCSLYQGACKSARRRGYVPRALPGRVAMWPLTVIHRWEGEGQCGVVRECFLEEEALTLGLEW